MGVVSKDDTFDAGEWIYCVFFMNIVCFLVKYMFCAKERRALSWQEQGLTNHVIRILGFSWR
jgi:hypothetical protein